MPLRTRALPTVVDQIQSFEQIIYFIIIYILYRSFSLVTSRRMCVGSPLISSFYSSYDKLSRVHNSFQNKKNEWKKKKTIFRPTDSIRLWTKRWKNEIGVIVRILWIALVVVKTKMTINTTKSNYEPSDFYINAMKLTRSFLFLSRFLFAAQKIPNTHQKRLQFIFKTWKNRQPNNEYFTIFSFVVSAVAQMKFVTTRRTEQYLEY